MPPVNTCSCAANKRRIFLPSVMPGTSVREKLIGKSLPSTTPSARKQPVDLVMAMTIHLVAVVMD